MSRAVGPVIVGTAGLPGSGKSKLAELAGEFGFRVITGGEGVRQEARNRGIEITDENLANLTETLRREEGEGALAERCLSLIDRASDSAVLIDSFRNLEETGVFEDEFGDQFYLIAVTAPFQERFKRLQERNRTDDIATRNQLRKRDRRELDWGSGEVIEAADITVQNDGTLDEFEAEVRTVLSRLLDEQSSRE